MQRSYRCLVVGGLWIATILTDASVVGAAWNGSPPRGATYGVGAHTPSTPGRPAVSGGKANAPANHLSPLKGQPPATGAAPSGRPRVFVKKVRPDAHGFELVGGQEAAVRELREAIELPLQHPEAFERMGIEPVRGVLLHGPPGTGKTALARAVADGMRAKMFVINASDVKAKFMGQSEENIRKVFDEAARHAPAVIFIDEIDAIAGHRDKADPNAVGMVTQLLTLMDGMHAQKGVVVVAATNRPDSLDPALRRPGRLEREVHVAAPDVQGRADILAIHTRKMPLAKDVDLAEVAHHTDGMSGADLAAVAQKAGMTALRRDVANGPREHVAPHVGDTHAGAERASPEIVRYLERFGYTPEHLDEYYGRVVADSKARGARIPSHALLLSGMRALFERIPVHRPGEQITVQADVKNDELHMILAVGGRPQRTWNQKLPRTTDHRTEWASHEGEAVTHADFMDAVSKTKPSTVREYSVEAPKVHWSDIAGLHDAKERLRDAVERPLTNPEGFARLGLRAPKGVLLYGPPGTGKTLLAKAVATESHANFISVKASDLVSKWHGESSQNIADLFKRARAVAPAVIFIDEIDSLAPPREGLGASDSHATRQIVTQLLQELDGVEALKGVTVVAATNHPDGVDSALRRPGRFDAQIYIGMPDAAARRQAFDVHTKRMPLAAGVDLDKLSTRTQGFTGADIENICLKAGYIALRKDHDAGHVTMNDFEAALAETHPSVTPAMERRYLATDKAQGPKPAAKIPFGFTAAKPRP